MTDFVVFWAIFFCPHPNTTLQFCNEYIAEEQKREEGKIQFVLDPLNNGDHCLTRVAE